MLTNPRRQKHFKIKFAAYILLLGILVISFFFLNRFILSRKPLFISPIGKISIDLSSVKKILKDNNISYSKVTLSDDSYLVNISDNGQVRLSQDKDIGKQISSLQRMLIQLTIEEKPLESMILGFRSPLFLFNKSMSDGKMVVGVDIGTSKIVTIIARVDDEFVNVLGVSEVASRGVKKGQIVDIKEGVNSINNSLDGAERM